MAKKELLPIIPDLDLDTLEELSDELRRPFGMSKRDFATRDGPRNLRMARALSQRGITLEFSGQEHGADAYWVRGSLYEELELKTAQEGNQFQLWTDASRETDTLLVRYANTSFMFGTFREEQLVEVFYLPVGTGLSSVFRTRLNEVRTGQPQKRRSMSLNQVKGYGATKLV